MKHCFAFFIKLVVGSILLIPSVDSAVCDRFLAENQAIPFARAHWLNSFKWAGDFVLKDGSVVRHTEQGITLEKDGIIVEPLTQELFITQRNGNNLCFLLDLKTQLSYSDFLCKLCQSELYQETKKDRQFLIKNGYWESEITVVNSTINGVECRTISHEFGRTYFRSENGNYINLSKAYTNEYGHKEYSSHTYCTKQWHLKHTKSDRKVCLSAELSCSEFTRMLFDCGHIIFQSYPPYTIQGEQDRSFTYYYYGDLKDPVKKRQIIVAPVRNIENETVIIPGVEPRENVRRVNFSKTNQTFIIAPPTKEVLEATEGEAVTAIIAPSIKMVTTAKNHRWTFNPLSWIYFYGPKR